MHKRGEEEEVRVNTCEQRLTRMNTKPCIYTYAILESKLGLDWVTPQINQPSLLGRVRDPSCLLIKYKIYINY